jgi:hypothetical protein
MELELDGRQHGTFRLKLPSSRSEPLADLLQNLLEIVRRYESDPGFGNTPEPFYTFWEGDPWQYTWAITPKRDRTLDVELTYCGDMCAGIHTKDELKMATEIPLDAFLENLYTELEHILVETGFVRYREKWRTHDFPIADFLQLRSIVHPASGPIESFRDEVAMLLEIGAK